MKRSARSRAAGRQKGVIPMQPRMKVAAVLIAVALIAVVGLIYITGQNKAEPQPQATVAATTATPDPTDEPDDADKEAQAQDAAAQDTMYEGALAGLTDEEIEQQALAEEAMEGAGGATND